MRFRIECVDAEGKPRQGTINAASVEAAIAIAKSKGLSLTSIVPVRGVPTHTTIPAPPKVTATTFEMTKEKRKTDDWGWPITFAVMTVAFIVALVLGSYRPIGILLATFPAALMVKRSWRDKCFGKLYLSRFMADHQQVLVLVVAVFTLVFSDGTESPSNYSPREVTPSNDLADQRSSDEVPGESLGDIAEEEPNESSEDTEEWYAGGTLQDKTLLEWRQATPEEKLATCARLIVDTTDNHLLQSNIRKSVSSWDDVRPFAEELVAYLDKVLSDSGQTVAETTLAAMEELQWMTFDDVELSERLRQLLHVDNAHVEMAPSSAAARKKSVIVSFDIGDSLTDGWIRTGAQIDVTDILKTLRKSGIPVAKLTVFGSFPMVDTCGNSAHTMVVRATYTGDTLDRINFDNFKFRNVYEVAESTYLHPAFRQ